jgi:hypothetical protein
MLLLVLSNHKLHLYLYSVSLQFTVPERLLFSIILQLATDRFSAKKDDYCWKKYSVAECNMFLMVSSSTRIFFFFQITTGYNSIVDFDLLTTIMESTGAIILIIIIIIIIKITTLHLSCILPDLNITFQPGNGNGNW